MQELRSPSADELRAGSNPVSVWWTDRVSFEQSRWRLSQKGQFGVIDDRSMRVRTPRSDRDALFGCEGCIYRKLTGCAQGRSEYPYGGPKKYFPIKHRDGYRRSA